MFFDCSLIVITTLNAYETWKNWATLSSGLGSTGTINDMVEYCVSSDLYDTTEYIQNFLMMLLAL